MLRNTFDATPKSIFSFLMPASRTIYTPSAEISVGMATRASARLRSKRTPSSKHAVSQEKKLTDCPGPSPASRRKHSATEAAAGVFPLLDDETTSIVVSYLASVCLGGRYETKRVHLALKALYQVQRQTCRFSFFSVARVYSGLGSEGQICTAVGCLL